MAEKKSYMVGNIRLSDLNGFEDTVKQGVRGCFIPYDQNPSLYVGVNRQTGVMTLDVDVLIRETSNSKSGATHFIKLSVGKANRERFNLSQEAVDSLKIVGNIYTRTPGQKPQEQKPAGSALQGPYAPAPGYGPAPQGGGFQGAPAPAYGPQPGGYPAPQGGAGW